MYRIANFSVGGLALELGARIQANEVRWKDDWWSYASQQALHYTCASESHEDFSRLAPGS